MVSPNAGFVTTLQAVRAFDLRILERSFVEIQTTIWSPFERRDPVVRVSGSESSQNPRRLVGNIVTVGVFHEQDVRLLGNVNTAMTKLKSRGNIQSIREDFA